MGKFAKHSVLVVLAGALGIGCILFVDSAKDLEGRCHFSGETATCGSCIVRACQGLVDQCCGDGFCRSEVTDLDACAVSGGAACLPITSPIASSPASDALATCLLQNCDKACGEVSGIAPPGETLAQATSCNAATNGKSCSCEVPSGSKAANTDTCTPNLIPNALCCAELDWPLAGTKCDCRKVTCATSNGGSGCTCNTFGDGPLTSCSTGGGCCSGGGGGCECGANPNLCALVPAGTTSFRSVASCGRTTVSCGDRKAVSRCSAQ